MKYLEFFRKHGIKVTHVAKKMEMRETHLRYYLELEEFPEKFKAKWLKFWGKYARELTADLGKVSK